MRLTTNKPKMVSDRAIAFKMLGGGVASTNALCSAAMAADNPDLKRMYQDFLQDALTGVEAMETYLSDQGWVKPFATPDEQLQLALQDIDELITEIRS